MSEAKANGRPPAPATHGSRERSDDTARVDDLIWDGGGRLVRLVAIMARLRGPEGCPWERRQDFRSIAPYTIEEAHEVAEAIERGDMGALRDELGDLLLQVVYHAQMAEEAGAFALEDVVQAISDKMVRRHPHVFGPERGAPATGPAELDWEGMKAAERAERGERRDSVLDGVPSGLPALARAVKLTTRAARVGFDWTDPADVVAKIGEEAAELAAEIGGDRDRIEDEYGDLLFVMANLARHLAVDPEAALRRANEKFSRRFRGIEARLRAEGRTPDDATLAEMDALWDAEKADERS